MAFLRPRLRGSFLALLVAVSVLVLALPAGTPVRSCTSAVLDATTIDLMASSPGHCTCELMLPGSFRTSNAGRTSDPASVLPASPGSAGAPRYAAAAAPAVPAPERGPANLADRSADARSATAPGAPPGGPSGGGAGDSDGSASSEASGLPGAPAAPSLFALLAVVLLYSRLGPAELHGSESRRRLVDEVSAHPGITFSELRSSLGLANGVLSYHLGVLERENALRSLRLAGRRRYVATGATVPGLDDLLPLRQRAIVRALARSPGLSQSGLARRLDLGRQTVSKGVRRLVEQGILARDPHGSRDRYRVASPDLAGTPWRTG